MELQKIVLIRKTIMFSLLSYVEIDNLIRECHSKNKKAIAFLPIGCTEQHGPFLPIQTDTIISENISSWLCRAISDDYWGYVFPSIAYTPTKSNMSYTGTLSVDEEQLRLYVTQICSGILRTAFDVIVFVSGHGPVDPSLNEISFNLVNKQYVDKQPVIKPMLLLSLYDSKNILESKFGQKSGQHADWRELLYLMYILGNQYFTKKRISDLIKFGKNNIFQMEESYILGLPIELRSVQGVIGDPIPLNTDDWSVMANIAWDETIKYFSELLKRKVDGFYRMESNKC